MNTAKKSKFGGGLLPATIKQVHDARDDSGEDSGFKIDGRECTQVVLKNKGSSCVKAAYTSSSRPHRLVS